jgi:DNA segregation ATPase FtsK/SpoIIIE, S-DNA-T family
MRYRVGQPLNRSHNGHWKEVPMSPTSNTQQRKALHGSNDEWIVILIWSLFKAAGYLLWLAILFPAISVPAFVSFAVTIRYGFGAGDLTTIGIAAGYGAWAALDAKSFDRWIMQPMRRQILSWWRYTHKWESICALHGLTMRYQDRTHTPQLRSVRIGKHTDAIDVRVATGQSVGDWHKRTAALAAAWRADRLTIRATTPGELRITITRFDVLAQPIGLPRPPANTAVNLSAVPVGMINDPRPQGGPPRSRYVYYPETSPVRSRPR